MNTDSEGQAGYLRLSVFICGRTSSPKWRGGLRIMREGSTQIGALMSTFLYKRHFVALILAALFLAFTPSIQDAIGVGNAQFVAIFGLPGALHSISLVVSLRRRSSALQRVVFVMLATVWSVAATLLAMGTPFLLGRLFEGSGDKGILIIAGLASALGTLGYWLLIRGFWLRSLKIGDLIPTLALCVLATVLSWVGAAYALPQSSSSPYVLSIFFLIMPAWWTAFSASLYITERDLKKQAASQGALA